MSKEFDFEKQLKVGSKGEDIFQTIYPAVTKTDGRKHDFMWGDKTIELKTDTYSQDQTENFFMEYYGDKKNKKMGGPWRSLADNVDYFVYMYIKDKECYWFEPPALVAFLDKYIIGKGYKQIRNRAWTAIGYTVKRKDIEHLRIQPPQK